MSLVLRYIFGINEDVVEVDDDANVEEVTENVIHEALESGGGMATPTLLSLLHGLPANTPSGTLIVTALPPLIF